MFGSQARKYFATLFPKHLREGPYRPQTKVALVAIGIALFATRSAAFADYALDRGTAQLCGPAMRAARLGCAAWGAAVLAIMHRRMGFGPLVSFTMQSPYIFG